MPTMDKLSTYKTNVMCTNGMISVVYQSTLIVDVKNDAVTLDSGGWETVTTKRKMNQASHQFDLGYYVYQRDFKWFVELSTGEVLDFVDGMTFKRGSHK